MSRAVKVQGIECPIIREGDNIVDIVVDSVLKEITIDWSETEMEDADMCDVNLPKYSIQNKSVIGITESVVARAAGQYITVDDIAADIEKKFGKDATICLVNPIYSRNRFAMILKGIARAAKKVIIVMPEEDEVGNSKGVNRFTGVNIEEYYKEVCEIENCECEIVNQIKDITDEFLFNWIDCRLHLGVHLHDHTCYDLTDICSDKSPDWGVLGTNKATEERLKLFPSKAECQRVCEAVKEKIKEKTGKDVIVCVYGDGCFKDFDSKIWEMADPCPSPGYTDKELLESTPNEIKVKYFADNGFNDNDIKNEIHNHNTSLIGNMKSQGTTPRRYINLLTSLMDLVSGSGERCTPIVLIQNYF